MLAIRSTARAPVTAPHSNASCVHQLLHPVQSAYAASRRGASTLASTGFNNGTQAHSRRCVLRQARMSTTDPWWEKDPAPNMRSINSVQDLVDALAENQDKLVIVDFYAKWCASCRALYPKLVQLLNQNLDNVVLLKVDFDDNKMMAKSLGVKVLPYFQFYRGSEGRVDAFSASITKIQRLKDALEQYGGAFCSLAPPPDLDGFPDVHPSSTLPTSSYDMPDEPDTPTGLAAAVEGSDVTILQY